MNNQGVPTFISKLFKRWSNKVHRNGSSADFVILSKHYSDAYKKLNIIEFRIINSYQFMLVQNGGWIMQF